MANGDMFGEICSNAIITLGNTFYLYVYAQLHKYVVKRFSCGRGRYIIAVMITPVKFIILWRQLVFMRAKMFNVCMGVRQRESFRVWHVTCCFGLEMLWKCEGRLAVGFDSGWSNAGITGCVWVHADFYSMRDAGTCGSVVLRYAASPTPDICLKLFLAAVEMGFV